MLISFKSEWSSMIYNDNKWELIDNEKTYFNNR